MKLTLPLAIDIADSVADASSREDFDIGSKASELISDHPEAEATMNEVTETLQEELETQSRPLRSRKYQTSDTAMQRND